MRPMVRIPPRSGPNGAQEGGLDRDTDQGWFLGVVCGGDEGAAGDHRALTKPFRLPGAQRI